MATQEMIVAALLKAAEIGLPSDIQELLIRGNPMRGIPAGVLEKMLDAATAARTPKQTLGTQDCGEFPQSPLLEGRAYYVFKT